MLAPEHLLLTPSEQVTGDEDSDELLVGIFPSFKIRLQTQNYITIIVTLIQDQ
jgi:hypothetical protein